MEPEKITRAKTFFIRKHPFYAALMLGMKFVNVVDAKIDGIDTMATDGTCIYYHPTFVDKHTEQAIIGTVAHEILHVVFMHPLRRAWREHMPWNVACDYAINAICTKDGFTLPDEGLTHPQGHDYAIDKSAEEMYEVAKAQAKSLEDAGIDLSKLSGGVLDGVPQGATEEEKKQAELQATLKVAQAATAAKMQGKLPASMERFVDELLNPKIDWKILLRRFFDVASKSDYSWKRQNRRYIHQGIYLPAMYSEGMSDLVIAVDTSGSIGQAELSAFFSEMRKIVEDCPIENIHVISCDAKAYDPHTFTRENFPEDVASMNKILLGGGGTRFAPVFSKLSDEGISPRALVYLTDLCGDDFGSQPDYPVMWITTHSETAPWGEIVKLEL